MQISVVIIARDSEKFLTTCISSVKSLTSDIIVVIDDRTSDNTYNIAAGLRSRVFVRNFINYSDQKNFADAQVENNWILSLDADEAASPGLVAAIKILSDKPLYQAFYIPRKNKVFGKYIDHTNWDPNGLIRLFNRDKCYWQGEVHEELKVDGEVSRLYDCIYHDNYRTVAEFVSRQDNYSTRRSDELLVRKVPFSLFRFFGEPLVDFGRRYILHAGFMDGLHGLFLSYLMAIYHLSVWIKLWQKYQKVSS